MAQHLRPDSHAHPLIGSGERGQRRIRAFEGRHIRRRSDPGVAALGRGRFGRIVTLVYLLIA
jgi:hypothetical protein